MNKILRILSVNIPDLGTSYDAVFTSSDCAGGDQCTCGRFDHNDEAVHEFEPAGTVVRWLTDNGYPIVHQDGRVVYLAGLTDVQRAKFQMAWGI